MSPDHVGNILMNIHVFARTSPNQKDFITRTLNSIGEVTAMCGDGTNDVGSLKSATIGIAVLNNKTPKQIWKEEWEEKIKRGESVEEEKVVLQPPPRPTFKELMNNPNLMKEWQQKMLEYQRSQGKFNPADFGVGPDSAMPELGDACIAAPFTYKYSSIGCVKKAIS